MFPLVSIPDLRDVVLAQPHSVLFAAAETLIERSLTPSKRATQPVFGADLLEAAVSALSRFFSSGVNGDDATSNRARPSKKGKERALGALDTSTDPVLTPHDLFHCPAYESALVAHFESLFPALAPLSSAPIERVVHRESGSYASMRERLERAAAEIEDERDRPWWSRWIGGSAGSARASGSTTAMGASLKRRGLVGKSANSSGRREVDPLIRSEVEAYERAQLGPPPPHAVETAVEQSGSAGAPLVECQCCFSPVPYAATHLACCSDPVAPASPPSSSPDPSVPPHFFCRDCVKAYVRTFTFGGTPLPAIALETSALPCISAAGPSPCVRVFSRRELSQTLDRTLATALASQITSATLERLALPPSASSASGSKLLRCPFCPYAELADPLPGALARVFLPAWVAEPFPPSLAQILVTLTGSVVLLLLLLLAGILALVTPARRLERTYDALHPADAGLGQRSLLGLPERLLLAPHHLPALCASYVRRVAERVLRDREGEATRVFRCRNAGRDAFGVTGGQEGRSAWLARLESVQEMRWGGTTELSGLQGEDEGAREGEVEERRRDALVRLLWGSRADHTEAYPTHEDDPAPCGKLSCLLCSRAVNPSAPSLHVCRASVSASTATTEPASEQEQAEESLRLAVERAMSDAVKRDCGRCGAALQKETGNGACNKVRRFSTVPTTLPGTDMPSALQVVCRCGFIYCHSCRREIPSWQGYGHFCPHPRDPDRVRRPDEPTCDRCDKCSLWDEPDEGQRVRKAVEQGESSSLHSPCRAALAGISSGFVVLTVTCRPSPSDVGEGAPGLGKEGRPRNARRVRARRAGSWWCVLLSTLVHSSKLHSEVDPASPAFEDTLGPRPVLPCSAR